jgi:hypothetical protein
MKYLIYFSFFICSTIFVNSANGQTFIADFEPFKPIYFEYDVMKEWDFIYKNGELIRVEEPKSQYNRRNAAHKAKMYNQYISSTEYRKWESQHIFWRNNHSNWKEITRYPELLTQEEQQARKRPKSIIGETYLVSSKTLNIRREPSKTSSIISILKIGDKVSLINSDNQDWWYIDNGQNKGFVFSEFLKIDPYSGWDSTNYKSGETPKCENVAPKYDYNLENYLRINVGSGTDVVVKLIKKGVYYDECIRIVYVRSGDTYDVRNIPEGQYYLKIAYGIDYRQKIVNNQCYVKFMQNALYEKGIQILDYNKIKNPDKINGGKIYESWNVPSFELSLGVISAKKSASFESNNISESEFNR